MDFDKIAQILRGEDRKMAMDLAMDLKTNSAGEMGGHESRVKIPNLSMLDMMGNGMGNGIRGSSIDPSDDEGDKTESETELDEDEHENKDEQVDAADATLTEDDDEMEGKMEADGNASNMYALDDFRNRSHYCHTKCKFQNEYRADEHMLCCESCDVWFHGKCLGYTEGDIANEQVWVCCENCFENLPISQRDIIVGKNKTGTFKRQIKKCELKQSVDKPKKIEKKQRVNQGKEMDRSKDEENKGEEEMAVPWSEDLRPNKAHFQSVPSAEPEKLYCTKSCKQRDNGNALMILCEVCTVWFHGSCVGIEDGDVKDSDAWVCCQKCKYDLPESLRNSALVGSSFKKQRETGTACVAKTLLDIAKKREVERSGRRRHRPPLSFFAIKRDKRELLVDKGERPKANSQDPEAMRGGGSDVWGIRGQDQTSGRQHPVCLQRIENENLVAGRT
jgi:hypothetical protein